jgi:hypothetical protein
MLQLFVPDGPLSRKDNATNSIAHWQIFSCKRTRAFSDVG